MVVVVVVRFVEEDEEVEEEEEEGASLEVLEEGSVELRMEGSISRFFPFLSVIKN